MTLVKITSSTGQSISKNGHLPARHDEPYRRAHVPEARPHGMAGRAQSRIAAGAVFGVWGRRLAGACPTLFAATGALPWRQKTELVHQREHPNRDAARRDLFAYIEGYYIDSGSTPPSATSPQIRQRQNPRNRCPLFRGKVTHMGQGCPELGLRKEDSSA